MEDYVYLQGAAFCIVYMTVLDAEKQEVQLDPFHGTSRVLADRILVADDEGRTSVIPDCALGNIHPSDGNAVLKEADYYVIVKVQDTRTA